MFTYVSYGTLENPKGEGVAMNGIFKKGARGRRQLAGVAAGLLISSLAGDAGEEAQPAAKERQPFDGIYTFGWIADDGPSHLNPGTNDFLLAFKVKPQKITRSNLPDTGLVGKKPFGNQAGYIAAITMNHGLAIHLNSREREALGEPDHQLNQSDFFPADEWTQAAILVEPSNQRVRVWKNGVLVKTFEKVALGNLDNWGDFTVGAANLPNQVRFRGQMDYAGVWTFDGQAPEDVAAHLAKLAEANDRAPLAGVPGARWSFWRLAKAEHGVASESPAGAFLHYMPADESLRFEAAARPYTAAAPRTLYVDVNSPAAKDDNTGTEDQPLRSVRRAAARAEAGDTIVVKPGLYREGLQVSGGRRGAPIRIAGRPGAVLSGAEELKVWVKTETEGVWCLKGWTGPFEAGNPQATDAQGKPGTLVFVGGAPLDWVDYVEDLIPGTYTAWPRERHKPVDLYIFPLPGESPEREMVEANVARGVSLADFVELEGFRVAQQGIGVNGEGCLVTNNTVEWNGIVIYGAHQRIIHNRILWGGITGLGGGGHTDCMIEGNYVAYSNWRMFSPYWHGGGAKFIPSAVHNIVRRNTFELNFSHGGIWYDMANSANVVEYNICHDGGGLFFDEGGIGNTFRYNIAYNSWCNRKWPAGRGIFTGGSPEDVFYRNIVFNCERTGLCPGYQGREMTGGDDPIAGSVKYPHHYLRSGRQREWLAKVARYHKGGPIPQLALKVEENILFNNHLTQLMPLTLVKTNLNSALYELSSDRNIFFSADTNRIVGDYDKSMSLAEWQRVSGQDQHSQIIDPYAQTRQLPPWARDLCDFRQLKFRPASEIAGLKLEVRDGIGCMVIKSRLARASRYRKLESKDRCLRAWMLVVEGTPMLALWRVTGAGMVRVQTGDKAVTFEDRWLRRKPVKPDGGRATVFVGGDPVYVIGVPETARVDETFKTSVYGTSGEVTIAPAPGEIKVDGRLDDWADLREKGLLAKLDSARQALGGSERNWEGTKDVSADVQGAWIPKGLYLTFEITDDSFAPGQDSVELFLDGRADWKHYIEEYDFGVHHLRLEPQADGTVKVTTPPYGKNTGAPSKPHAVGVEAAARIGPGGYAIELFFPWDRRNVEADAIKPDTMLRMGVLINDGDAHKQGVSTLKWNASRDSSFDTRLWLPVSPRQDTGN
jgi:hypothetical protein